MDNSNNTPNTPTPRAIPQKNQYSYVFYEGDGTTSLFSIPFPFLDRKHISFTVDKEPVPDETVQWLSNSTVRFAAPPAAGTLIQVQRFTEKLLPVVDFKDGSTLTEEDLDLAVTQLLFICQEAYDALDGETAVAAKEEALKILKEIQELYGKTQEEINYFRKMYIVVEQAEGQLGSGEYDFETGRMLFRIPAGPTGPQGPQGAEGPQGIAGAVGPQGPRGIQGIQGTQGARGPEGQQGLMGPQGIQGPRGEQGEVGPVGPQGVKGDAGERGPQGPEGPQGATGDKGPLGDSPLPLTFGNMRVNTLGYLEFEYNGGPLSETMFNINPTTGEMEVHL